SQTEDMSPREFAERVSNIIVDGTQFSFEPALQEFEQDGLHLIDVPATEAGTYYVRSRVEVSGSSEFDYGVQFAISHQAGEIEVQLGGDVIYSGSTTRDGHLNYVDYGLFEYQEIVPITVEDGEHVLTIRFTPRNPGQDRIYFSFVRSDNALPYPAISVHSPTKTEELEHYGYWWIGPVSADTEDEILMDTKRSDKELVEMEVVSANGTTIRWDIPRLHLVKSLPGWLTYQNWHYSGGTFLDAMNEVGKHFDGLEYGAYINEHMYFLEEHIDEIGQMMAEYGLIEAPFGHYFRFSLLDDMGMQTVPYVNRMLENGVDDNSFGYKLANKVTNHIMNDASRLPDGTWARFTPDTMSVWADDLFMGSIVLLKMYELTGNEDYLDQVITQVLNFDSYLVDEPSKLYWHGYFSWNDEYSSTKWGRANGWTIMAKVELLQTMPEDHPQFEAVLGTLTRHCEGLLAVQSLDGRWHQVLDDPGTYLETSATAMFVRGFATGITEGWLDRSVYEAATELGWASLTRQFDEEGNVIGIVRGTPIMFSDEEYDNWGTRINDPRGLGALLYAAIAIDEMRNTQ
ncbi:MAG: glycoside hydrolase family 88 protein, partial [Balneolales bacterium]|nr:glycoside hydrolase family 88 protein [Balneolales bacterium]